MRAPLVAALVLAACGAGAQDVAKARSSAYNTDYATVWNAVAAEMHDRYHDDGILKEDAVNGYVESKWKTVELVQDSTVGDSDQRTNQAAGSMRAGNVMRIAVKILPGGPPWRIRVDGEAAQWRPGLTMLTPFKHGTMEEPHWVPGKIDSVVAGIHERLKAYAVDAGPNIVVPSKAQGGPEAAPPASLEQPVTQPPPAPTSK